MYVGYYAFCFIGTWAHGHLPGPTAFNPCLDPSFAHLLACKQSPSHAPGCPALPGKSVVVVWTVLLMVTAIAFPATHSAQGCSAKGMQVDLWAGRRGHEQGGERHTGGSRKVGVMGGPGGGQRGALSTLCPGPPPPKPGTSHALRWGGGSPLAKSTVCLWTLRHPCLADYGPSSSTQEAVGGHSPQILRCNAVLCENCGFIWYRCSPRLSPAMCVHCQGWHLGQKRQC